MKKAIEIYDGSLEGGMLWDDFQLMLNEFGEILLQVDDKNYQGDSRLLYKNGNRIGYLCVGWGSCFGCDALLWCEDIKQAQELMDELYESIKWFDSKELALKFFNEHNWDFDYGKDEEFITKAEDILIKLGV